MQAYDLLLKGGTIIDGTGALRRTGDIAIKDGRIVSIGNNLGSSAAQVLDVAGKIVAPGVIDPHTHYDAQINWDPYCTSSGWHGNTSFVVGNCGFGFMPCRTEDRERYMLMMENTEQVPLGAMRSALLPVWDWQSFPEWMEHMKRLPKGVNVASFMPLNSLMIFVMGYEAAKSRGATPAERQEMRRLLNEAMDAGAIGFGFSYLNEFNSHKDCDGTPMPTDMMQIEDAYYLAEVLRERGEGLIQVLAELPNAVRNREACERLAEISGRPVLHTVTAAFDAYPEYHSSILAWLDECEARGLEIYTQALAFRSWTENRVVDYDAWQYVPLFHELTRAGDAAAKARLAADPDYRKRAMKTYDPVKMAGGGGSIESHILLSAPGAKDWERYCGKLFGEIARERGATAIEALLDVIVATGAMAELRSTEATTADIKKLKDMLAHPRCFAGTSDGGAHVKGYCGGHFATDNIMQLVRETGSMTLEAMHWKLSALPAGVFNFVGRGTLVEGNWADIYVYDLNELGYNRERYTVLHDLPDGDWRRVVKASGIEFIIVNGEITFHHDVHTGNLSGRMISNKGATLDKALANAAA